MDRLRLCFSDLRADALLVTQLPNIFYLTGFSGQRGLAIGRAGECVFS